MAGVGLGRPLKNVAAEFLPAELDLDADAGLGCVSHLRGNAVVERPVQVRQR